MLDVLRWITAGESHGPALVAMLEGMVAGVEVTSDDISAQLARRRLGYGRGARMKFEADKVTIIGGVRHGRTLGGPIAVEVGNTEWPKWETIMSADPVDEPNSPARRATRRSPVRVPGTPTTRACSSTASTMPARCSSAPAPVRPRPVSPPVPSPASSSGSSSASRCSRTSLDRRVRALRRRRPEAGDLEAIDASPVRAFDKAAEDSMIAEIEAAKKDGDTLGGVVEVIVHGLPSASARSSAAPIVSTRSWPPPDGHPGDQGRRGRRRLRDRTPSR